MIEPDLYINEYFQINQANLSKPIQTKYTNLNFSRLQPEKKLLSVKADILIKPNFNIREYIDWDLADEKRTPKLFADSLVEQLQDIIEADLHEYNRTSIRNQILDQLLEHVDKNTFLPRLRLIKKDL